MQQATQTPFYLRFGLTVITIGVLCAGLFFARSIVLPFFFGILLATLLLPVTKLLQRAKLGRVTSISISVFSAMLLLGLVVYLISTQVGHFLEDFPKLEKRLNELILEGHKWVQQHLQIGVREQREYLNETTEKMKTDSTAMLGKTVVTITEAISYVIFLPIYSFLILYHKDMIKRFLIEICKDGDEQRVHSILEESQLISQQYITGLMIELCIVFALNATGFLILGIKYAIFLALLSALLNLVPYIGMLVANILSILITLVSSSQASDAIWVSVVLTAVQLIDNNVLMPLIVGNKVKLNAIAIILGVLFSGALAGVAGMFLAIPGLAVLKLVFERVDRLKPWAILLGDETTEELDQKNPVKRTFRSIRSRKQSVKS